VIVDGQIIFSSRVIVPREEIVALRRPN